MTQDTRDTRPKATGPRRKQAAYPKDKVPTINSRADHEAGIKKLSKEEARFVVGVIRRMDPIEVCRTLGYAEPDLTAYEFLGRAHVQEALRARAMRHVFGALLPSALLAHQEILDDRAAPPSARMQAVRAVYDLVSLSGDMNAEHEQRNNVPISEMSAQELQSKVDRLRNDLAQLDNSLVDITP